MLDTENELVEEEEKEKIPIDQLRAVDETLLQTAEEREIFRSKRFGSAKGKTESDATAAPVTRPPEELEEIAQRAPAEVPGPKQYGSPLTTVLEEMQSRYRNPHDVAQEATKIILTAAYSHDMTEEEKWRTYGDAKSLMAALEDRGAPSQELRYLANATQKIVDSQKMQYRT